MPTLRIVFSLVRRTEPSFLLHLLINTLRTNYLNRKYFRIRRKESDASEHTPGRLLSIDQFTTGAKFNFQYASLTVRFLNDDLLHVVWEPGRLSPAYALAQSDWPRVEVNVGKEGEVWRVCSQEIILEVHEEGELRFYRHDGVLVRRELPPKWTGLKSDPGWRTISPLQSEEGIFGLGEQTEGLNLRGSRHIIWNKDPSGSYAPGKDPIYMPLPLYLCLSPNSGYLVFYANPHAAWINIDSVEPEALQSNPKIEMSFERGALSYYFILGEPKKSLMRLSELSGKPFFPPRWSLGYHQSRWGYRTQEEVLQICEAFYQMDMPLSAIHLDIDYMRGYRVFTVDENRFPNLKALAQTLEAKGVKLVCILDPGVKCDEDFHVYREGRRIRAFCTLSDGKEYHGAVWPGKSAFPDFTREEVRRWWGAYYRGLIEQGIAGIWHDMNEPTSFSLLGQNTLPFETQHAMDGQGGDHMEAHNVYALMMNRAGFEALKGYAPHRRPWILSRSGWVSQQRYAWKWTGDCESSWESLRATLPNILGMGLSGIPFNGVDIGGFSGNPSAELYLRWFQLATFLPLFRTHSAIGTNRREPWVFGEPYTSIIRRFLKFRYALMPYLYTLAWECHRTGWPMIRPMFWDQPERTEYWQIEDQFFLGEALLIAPIVLPGKTSRQVLLPEGTWFNLWNNDICEGSGEVEVSCGWETIPVFVRAGSVLPLQLDERLSFRVFPPQEGHNVDSQFYWDDGDGYGDFHLSRFECSRKGKSVHIHWQLQAALPFPFPLVEFDLHALSPKKVLVGEQSLRIENSCVTTAPFETMWIEEG